MNVLPTRVKKQLKLLFVFLVLDKKPPLRFFYRTNPTAPPKTSQTDTKLDVFHQPPCSHVRPCCDPCLVFVSNLWCVFFFFISRTIKTHRTQRPEACHCLSSQSLQSDMGKKQHGTALRKARCRMSVEMQLKFVLSFIFGVVQFEIPGIVLSDSSDTWMLYIGK